MKLFIYGTLLNHPTLSYALRYLPKLKKATLDNVSIKSYNGYPTLVPLFKHQVKGEVFEVSDEGLRRLDKWEEKYMRISILLSDSSQAETYVLKSPVFSSDKGNGG